MNKLYTELIFFEAKPSSICFGGHDTIETMACSLAYIDGRSSSILLPCGAAMGRFLSRNVSVLLGGPDISWSSVLSVLIPTYAGSTFGVSAKVALAFSRDDGSDSPELGTDLLACSSQHKFWKNGAHLWSCLSQTYGILSKTFVCDIILGVS